MKYIYKIIFLCLSLILLQSCCRKEARYEYGGIVIKRIDVCGKTTFYYDHYGKIWVEYSGINDGFDAYLVFEKNGKVTIIVGDGYFQKKVSNDLMFSFVYMDGDYWHITHDSQYQENVYRVFYPMIYEIDRNKNTKTKVKAIYKD